MDPSTSENARLALAGELYHAFVPELNRARARCKHSCNRYNNAGDVSRRRQIELWRDIVQDTAPLPSLFEDPDQDAAQFENEPWVEGPVRIDYGTNLRLGKNVYINFNCTILDTCLVTIGSRTLLASNVSLYSATHPLDPVLRNGTKGPELGKEIHIGEDCFIGGNATVCPGVKIGSGSTVGAGSVVTRDVPKMCVVAGNPARIIRWLDGKAVKGEVKEVDGMLRHKNGPEANSRAEIDAKGAGQDRENKQEKRSAIGQPKPRVSTRSQGSEEKSKVQDGDERLMTQVEWEDEMGRQIAERALSYGASLK